MAICTTTSNIPFQNQLKNIMIAIRPNCNLLALFSIDKINTILEECGRQFFSFVTFLPVLTNSDIEYKSFMHFLNLNCSSFLCFTLVYKEMKVGFKYSKTRVTFKIGKIWHFIKSDLEFCLCFLQLQKQRVIENSSFPPSYQYYLCTVQLPWTCDFPQPTHGHHAKTMQIMSTETRYLTTQKCVVLVWTNC